MNQALQFCDDGSFTIVQFTDLHWHDGTGLDVRTASLMEMVLDDERPDLVVLTGDVLEGSECPEYPFQSSHSPHSLLPLVARLGTMMPEVPKHVTRSLQVCN